MRRGKLSLIIFVTSLGSGADDLESRISKKIIECSNNLLLLLLILQTKDGAICRLMEGNQIFKL